MHWIMLVLWLGLVVAAVRNHPRSRREWRMAALLLLFALPWALAVASSPFVVDHHAMGAAGKARLITLQQVAIAAAGALLVAAVIASLRLAYRMRAFLVAASLVLLAPLAILVLIDIVIIDPGS